MVLQSPRASHVVGAWKQLISSVRRVVLDSKERFLTDDQLKTLFAEAEAIINARPLTVLTLGIDGQTPLTPNHILKVNVTSELPLDQSNKCDRYSRIRWHHVLYLADQF